MRHAYFVTRSVSWRMDWVGKLQEPPFAPAVSWSREPDISFRTFR